MQVLYSQILSCACMNVYGRSKIAIFLNINVIYIYLYFDRSTAIMCIEHRGTY
ncbi:MAG: hypothetical protein NVSMB44_27630 [Ktedonobacteraceae bacterium]